MPIKFKPPKFCGLESPLYREREEEKLKSEDGAWVCANLLVEYTEKEKIVMIEGKLGL
jgi:hypothetical protein